MRFLFIYLITLIKISSQSNWIPDHTNILPDGQYGIGDKNVFFTGRVTVEDLRGESFFTDQIINKNGIFKTKKSGQVLSGKVYIDRFDVGMLKNGKRNGEWKILWNGELLWSGGYKDGMLNGKIISWYVREYLKQFRIEDKRKKWEITFKEGKLDGEYIEYSLIHNEKIKEGNYKGDKKEGLWTYKYKIGILESIGEYAMDKKNGLWSYYYENDILESIGEYAMDKKNGHWLYYYENGAQKEEGSYKNSLKFGTWTKWNNKNTKIEEGSYEIIDSLKKEYKNGTWMYWFSDGELQKKEVWEKRGITILEEIRQEWYDTQKEWEKSRGKIINGMKDGLWEYWREDRSPWKIETYKNGKKHGCFINYNTSSYDSGKEEFYYENDSLIKIINYFYQYSKNIFQGMNPGEGVKKSEVHYKNRQPFGFYKLWYESGALNIYGRYEGNDSNGDPVKDGEWLYFNESGELIDKKTYKNGKRRWIIDKLKNKNKHRITYSWYNDYSIKEIKKFKINNDILIEKIYYSKKGDVIHHSMPLENFINEKYDLKPISYHPNGVTKSSFGFFGLDTNERIFAYYDQKGRMIKKNKEVNKNGKKALWEYQYHENGKLKEEICYIKWWSNIVKEYSKKYYDNGQIAMETKYCSKCVRRGIVHWTDAWNQDGTAYIPIKKGMEQHFVEQLYRSPSHMKKDIHGNLTWIYYSKKPKSTRGLKPFFEIVFNNELKVIDYNYNEETFHLNSKILINE
jgi:antitoxin component YwqK of YwqJK toxin-antitoxin module